MRRSSKINLCLALGLLSTALLVNCSTEEAPAVEQPSMLYGEVQLDLAAAWLTGRDPVHLEPTSALDASGRTWIAGLEFSETQGELELNLVVGVLGPEAPLQGGLSFGTVLSSSSDSLASPRLCAFEDTAYLVYEEGQGEQRRIIGSVLTYAPDQNGSPITAGPSEVLASGHALFPTVVETSPGRLEVAYQALARDRYEIRHSVRQADGTWSSAKPVFDAPGEYWHPEIASRGDGLLHLVCDVYDGERFVVEYATIDAAGETTQLRVADSHGYQGMPALALDRFGRTWIAWEQAEQFGEIGGLRAERELRIASIEGAALRDVPVNVLADENGLARRSDFPRIVCSPEGLLVTARTPGGTWVPEFAKEEANFYSSWFTRVLTFDDEGRAAAGLLRATDGDGEATEVLMPAVDGSTIACVFAADLRTRQRPKPFAFEAAIETNWRLGLIELPAPTGFPQTVARSNSKSRASDSKSATSALPTSRDSKQLLFGDLHRHTQQSRCQGTLDGTTLDVYRYARGPGQLDFVSITDHYQHMTPWSLWRGLRDVERFNAPGSLVTLAGMERALRERAHVNEVFLKTEEVPREVGAFHREVDAVSSVPVGNTLAIPHMMGTASAPFPWKYFRGDLHRVLEVYQGLRGGYEGEGLPFEAMNREINSSSIAEGLRRGLHFGLIAASDHRASSSAYAGIWAKSFDRAGVFAALRGRDTFASTSQVAAVAQLGSLAMGAEGPCSSRDALEISAAGAVPVATVEVIKNGELFARRAGTGNRELIVVSCRRYQELGTDPPHALEVGLRGGTILAARERMQGRTGAELVLADGHVSLTKRIPWIDFVLEIERDPSAGNGPVLELTLGELSDEVRIDDIEPGRSIKHPAKLVRESIWRIGAPLAERAGSTGLQSFLFEDPEREAGDSYYARVAFVDGNLAWTSPIRVTSVDE